MPPISELFQFTASGVALFGLFWLWKKGAARWSTWFPALKKGLEWSLLGCAVLWLFWTVTLFSSAPSLPNAALAFVVGLAVPSLIGWRKGPVKEETKRGSTLADAKKVARMVKATKQQAALSLGGVPIPFEVEPYHFMVAGSTGTGKSVAISTLLDTLQARNDTVILVDSGGGFLSKYYREDVDFVFNPYDERCVGWSPTAEMAGAWDAQALARSIIPDGTGDAKEWNSYAQTFVASVLRRLWETKRLSLQDFLYFVQVAPVKELKTLLEGTPASSQLDAEKTFGSIRTIAGNYISSYDYLPTKKESFSVAEMIRAEHSGMLFVTYRDDQLDSLRSLIGCLLDVAARTILSLEPSPNRRVWLIIDEFASIGKVQSIEQVATKARKAGGCLVLGLQSVSQLKDRYGEHGAQTILSCLSTWLVLRCSDADTADYMSKYIGEAEIQRSQKSASNSDSGGSESWSEQSTTQRVVLASEIQAYPNLEGLLKLAGDYPVCSVKLSFPAKRAESTPSFESRDFQSNPLLKLTPTDHAKSSRMPRPGPAPVAPEADEEDARNSAHVAPSLRNMVAELRTPPPLEEGDASELPKHARSTPSAPSEPPSSAVSASAFRSSRSEDMGDAESSAATELLDGADFFELPSSKQRRAASQLTAVLSLEERAEQALREKRQMGAARKMHSPHTLVQDLPEQRVDRPVVRRDNVSGAVDTHRPRQLMRTKPVNSMKEPSALTSTSNVEQKGGGRGKGNRDRSSKNRDLLSLLK